LAITSGFLFSFSGVKALDPEINFSKLARSIIGARYQPSEPHRLKVILNKDNLNYYYGLNSFFLFDFYPLQLGNGTYKLSVMENTTGSKYMFITTTDVQQDNSDGIRVYLQSMKIVNWNMSSLAVKRAFDLTSGLNGDILRIRAVYNYVVKTIKYDSAKLGTLPEDYTPDLDQLINDKKGICYDYSAIMASMLRSIGIPAKLIMGYTPNINGYHAWNEVYLKSEGRWIVIDTTYDAAMENSGGSYSMEKAAADYSNISFYY
jgi:transglutaminase-like putative cysteine protease